METANTARRVQWDKKREGRTRNLAAGYDYVHKQSDRSAVDRLTRYRWYEFIRHRAQI
jgi:hypothetical protein